MTPEWCLSLVAVAACACSTPRVDRGRADGLCHLLALRLSVALRRKFTQLSAGLICGFGAGRELFQVGADLTEG